MGQSGSVMPFEDMERVGYAISRCGVGRLFHMEVWSGSVMQ